MKKLQILLLEDDALDAALTRAILQNAQIPHELRHVDTEDDFCAALDSGRFDLILADYVLPAFDGLAALEIARRKCPDTPFIFLFGTLGEETAIETLKNGATDYVLKQRLRRLPAAIDRTLRESQERSARQAAEDELRKAKEVAETANRAKDQFLAALSHELRTPLNPVLAAVTLLENHSALPDELRPYVQMIHRNAELQARLIDDLLGLTRIAKGKFELHREPVDLHALVQRTLEICHEDIQQKALQVHRHLHAEPAMVYGDAARLSQVLWNLLKNAIKFTPPNGAITIRSQRTADAFIELSVRDTGIGMNPDVLNRIFNAFEQGNTAITHQFGGLGLGLAIAKAVVETHGGRISAESAGKDFGSTFMLRLPCLSPFPPSLRLPEAARPAATSPLRNASLRILLVEDHEDTARIMTTLLTSFQHQVTCARTVHEALDLAIRQSFDLVISDIGLPDGSGTDLMRQLREKRPIRGIALSGYGMERDIQNSLAAGFLAHLTKPISLPKLQATIQEVQTLPPPAPLENASSSPFA